MPRRINYWEPMKIQGDPKLSMTVAAYRRPELLNALLWGFLTQTYENWEVVVVHDGPGDACRDAIAQIGDPRIRLVETPERKGQWGNPWRKWGVEHCTGDYVGMTDEDNFYAPVYFEWMLSALVTTDSDFAHCDLVHSHNQWQAVSTRPLKGSCDLGSWVARADLVKRTPWTDYGGTGDGEFVEALVRESKRVVHVPGVLMLHN